MAAAAALADPFPLLGPYHVLRTSSSVAAEVRNLLDTCEANAPWWTEVPGWFFMLDCESWGPDAPAPNLARIHEAADRLVTQTGKRVLVYAPQWVYGDSLAGLRYPLVSSKYGGNPAVNFRSGYDQAGGDASGRWSRYSGIQPTILQYGSRLIIGSQPTCDANAFRGTLPELVALLAPAGGDDIMAADYGGLGPPTYGRKDADGRPLPQERWRHDHPDIHTADLWSLLWRGAGAWMEGQPAAFDPGTAFGRWANKLAADAAGAAAGVPLQLTDDQVELFADRLAAGVAERLAVPLVDLLSTLRAVGEALRGDQG